MSWISVYITQERGYMIVQVRPGVFETNSSSTHSLNICTKSDYEKWANNSDIVFIGESWSVGAGDFGGREFVTKQEIIDCLKKKNESITDEDCKYPETIEEYFERDEDVWYSQSASSEDGIFDYNSYELDNEELESYFKHFTTPSGDEMVAFGLYGYQG